MLCSNLWALLATHTDRDETVTEEVYKTKETVEENIPMEYKQALRAAESYLDTMSFSKGGLFNQLTSEYVCYITILYSKINKLYFY